MSKAEKRLKKLKSRYDKYSQDMAWMKDMDIWWNANKRNKKNGNTKK